MNERFKLLRATLGVSQEEFGQMMGISKSGVSSIESGQRNVTDKHIKLLVVECNVNEQWLRTGEGEMFNQVPEEDEVAAYVAELLDDEENSLYTIIKEIMRTYNELDKKSQDVIKESCNKLLDNLSKRKEG